MTPGDGSGRLPAPSVAAASASGDELARAAALAEYGILDTEPEEAFDALASLAAHICGTPMAAVSFLDSDRQWFKAEVGLGVSQTARELSFCQHAIAAPADVLVVPDARTDARFAANPLVSGSPGLRFYAGAPMVTPAGAALGSVCVLDSTPRELTAEQRAALQALSRQAVALLEARRTLGELALASRERERQQERLRRTGADALTGLGSRSWFTAELAVLLPDAGRPTAVGVAARLREALSQPAELASVRLVSDACVGVATARPGAATATGRSVEAAALELLRNATLALDAAKAAGAGQVQTYRRALHTRAGAS